MLTNTFNADFIKLQLDDSCGCATVQSVAIKNEPKFPILESLERGVTRGDIRYRSLGSLKFQALGCCQAPAKSNLNGDGCVLYSKRKLFGAVVSVCCDDTTLTIDQEKVRVMAQAKKDLSLRVLYGDGATTYGIANHPEAIRANVNSDIAAQNAIFEAMFRATAVGAPVVIVSAQMMRALLNGQPTVGTAFTSNLQMLTNMLCSACDNVPKIIVSNELTGKQAFVFPSGDLTYFLSEYEGGLCKDMVDQPSDTSTWLLMANVTNGFSTDLYVGYAFAGVIGQMQYTTHINYI